MDVSLWCAELHYFGYITRVEYLGYKVDIYVVMQDRVSLYCLGYSLTSFVTS